MQLSGSAGARDSVISGTLNSIDTLSCPQDTPAYAYTRDQYMVNARYLPATSISGGNNRNVKSLSYTGARPSDSTGKAGDTVFVYAGCGLIGGGARIGDSAVVGWTVLDQDTARFVVPAGSGTGKSFTVWNSDVDTLTITGAFKYSSGKKSYGYGYKKYRY